MDTDAEHTDPRTRATNSIAEKLRKHIPGLDKLDNDAVIAHYGMQKEVGLLTQVNEKLDRIRDTLKKSGA
jgi:hypothetical protein